MEDIKRTRRGQRAGRGWVAVTRGVHRSASADDPFLAELRAWQAVLPVTARFTHLTAARARGWWLPPLPEDLPVFVAMDQAGTRPVRPGLRISRHADPPDPERVDGLHLDPAPEVLLACARDLSELDLVVLMDAALHLGDVTSEDVDRVAGQRRRGAPALRRTARLADRRSESPWETLLRRLHQVVDVDVEPQHDVHDAHGTFVARGDLWVVGTRMLHEYDGDTHLEKPRQRQDLQRHRRLGNTAWERRGYTSRDVLHQGVTILRDADLALGRPHEPERIRPWHDLVRASLFTPAGTSAFRRRLGLLTTGEKVS